MDDPVASSNPDQSIGLLPAGPDDDAAAAACRIPTEAGVDCLENKLRSMNVEGSENSDMKGGETQKPAKAAFHAHRQRSMSESIIGSERKGILKRRLHCSLSECESCFDISGNVRAANNHDDDDVCHNFDLAIKKTVRFSENVERNEYPAENCATVQRKRNCKVKSQVSSSSGGRLESFSEEEEVEEDRGAEEEEEEEEEAAEGGSEVQDVSEMAESRLAKPQMPPPQSPRSFGRFQCVTVEKDDVKVLRINASSTAMPMKSRFRVVRVAEMVDT